MEFGRFFSRSFLSLYDAVKYCDPKFIVVVGDSWLFVVVSSISIALNR